jgi:hypothetical protein
VFAKDGDLGENDVVIALLSWNFQDPKAFSVFER